MNHQSVEQEIKKYLSLNVREVECVDEDELIDMADAMEILLDPISVSICWEAFTRFTRQVVSHEFEGIPFDIKASPKLTQPTKSSSIGTIELCLTLPNGTLHTVIALEPCTPINVHGAVASIHSVANVVFTSEFHEYHYERVSRTIKGRTTLETTTTTAIHSAEPSLYPLSYMVDHAQYGDALRYEMPSNYITHALMERIEQHQPVGSVELEV